jgi:hypothetical protein
MNLAPAVVHLGGEPAFLCRDGVDLEAAVKGTARFIRIDEDPSADAVKRDVSPALPFRPRSGRRAGILGIGENDRPALRGGD